MQSLLETNVLKNSKAMIRDMRDDERNDFEDFLDGMDALSRIKEPSKGFERAVNKIIKIKSPSA